MINTILTLVLLSMYVGLSIWSFKITQKVGNELTAELTHLGMLVITVWAISSMFIASWILF